MALDEGGAGAKQPVSRRPPEEAVRDLISVLVASSNRPKKRALSPHERTRVPRPLGFLRPEEWRESILPIYQKKWWDYLIETLLERQQSSQPRWNLPYFGGTKPQPIPPARVRRGERSWI
jgi:hypothetical protein